MIKKFDEYFGDAKKRLFLDDWRVPTDCAQYMWQRKADCRIYHEKWDIVRSHGDFIRWIERNGIPDVVSLDYDLDDVEELKENLPIEDWFDLDDNRSYNGADCVRHLIRECERLRKPLPEYLIHSANPDGSVEMRELLDANR